MISFIVKNLIILEGFLSSRMPSLSSSPVFYELEAHRIFLMKQQELREKVKYLKWHEGIDYKTIASAIGMNENSFYNFLNNDEINLSYKLSWRLQQYILEVQNGELE